jgi:hypothetical protein
MEEVSAIAFVQLSVVFGCIRAFRQAPASHAAAKSPASQSHVRGISYPKGREPNFLDAPRPYHEVESILDKAAVASLRQ